MRDYVSEDNLKRALPIAAVVTLLSLPRIHFTGFPLGMYGVAAFLSMLLIGGAATAWGRKAGMAGCFPDRRLWIGGVLVASLVLLVLVPIQRYVLDPPILAAMEQSGAPETFVLRHYPITTLGRAAMVLWTAGFETLFFVAAPMAFFGRLTGRVWVAVVFTALFRTTVTAGYLSYIAMPAPFLTLTFGGIQAVTACVLFARAGLIPASFFAAGTCIHQFLL
jgi:hypothetical protein